jgi:hypothetical protein
MTAMRSLVSGEILKRIIGLLAVTTLCMASASAQNAVRVFDPSALKGPAKGKQNEVIVLGTAHLAQLPSTFLPANLDILKERLFAWKPRIVAIESLPGTQCDMMRRYPQRYDGTIQRFCTWDPAPARAATGLDVPGATVEMDRLLANWPAEPTSSQRRHLAAIFLAAGEPVSALVQWLRLPQAERRVGDGLDATLVEALDKRRFGRGLNRMGMTKRSRQPGTILRTPSASGCINGCLPMSAVPRMSCRFIAQSMTHRTRWLFTQLTSVRPSTRHPRNNSAAAMSPIGKHATCVWPRTSGKPSETIQETARLSSLDGATRGISKLI